jgi:FkbM family methyltransferase
MGSVRDALLHGLIAGYPLRHGRKALVRWAAARLGGAIPWTTADGTRLLLDPRNYIDREIVLKGGYEAEAIAAFVVEALQCDAFLDIGANIGLYAIAVARATTAEVIAFEPDPRNLAQLNANLFLNGLETRVRVRGEAVGAMASEGTLFAQRDGKDFSTALSGMAERPAGSVEIAVPVVALDGLYPWKGRRLAIKMDIEGYELQALQGMTDLLAENSVYLQIEIAPQNLERARALLKDCALVERPQRDPSGKDYFFATAVTR